VTKSLNVLTFDITLLKTLTGLSVKISSVDTGSRLKHIFILVV